MWTHHTRHGVKRHGNYQRVCIERRFKNTARLHLWNFRDAVNGGSPVVRRFASTSPSQQSSKRRRLYDLHYIRHRYLFFGSLVGLHYISFSNPNLHRVESHSKTVRTYDPSQTLFCILALNAFIFFMWKLPFKYESSAAKTYHTLIAHFQVAARTSLDFRRLHTHLLSMFSHQRFSHLCGNMVLLWIFGGPLHEAVGRNNFLAIYLGGGFFGSLSEAFYNKLVRKPTLNRRGFGASGAVSATYFAMLFCIPQEEFKFDSPVPIIGDLKFNKKVLMACMLGYEILCLCRGWGQVAHMVHIVGYLFGILSVQIMARGTTYGERLVKGIPYTGPLKNFFPVGKGGILHKSDGDYEVDAQEDGSLQLTKIGDPTKVETFSNLDAI